MPTFTLTPRQWANAMLAPGVACILDTETTGLDGSIIEVAQSSTPLPVRSCSTPLSTPTAHRSTPTRTPCTGSPPLT
ncbi:hypothetical protein [Prescottella equi]|uniref:hypothetical protein n=1 Tax=Rhodococcus hoagii TaxID=43767 RepID=UPI003080276E